MPSHPIRHSNEQLNKFNKFNNRETAALAVKIELKLKFNLKDRDSW